MLNGVQFIRERGGLRIESRNYDNRNSEASLQDIHSFDHLRSIGSRGSVEILFKIRTPDDTLLPSTCVSNDTVYQLTASRFTSNVSVFLQRLPNSYTWCKLVYRIMNQCADLCRSLTAFRSQASFILHPSMQAPAKNIMSLYLQPARNQSFLALTRTWLTMSHCRTD